jgi:hypothetical protein
VHSEKKRRSNAGRSSKRPQQCPAQVVPIKQRLPPNFLSSVLGALEDAFPTPGGPVSMIPSSTQASKRVRRKASEIDHEFLCPRVGCGKRHSSDHSLKEHIRLKHKHENLLPPPLQCVPGMPTSARVGVGVGVGIGAKEVTASDRLVVLPIYKRAHLCNVLTSSHTQNALVVRGPKMKMKLFVARKQEQCLERWHNHLGKNGRHARGKWTEADVSCLTPVNKCSAVRLTRDCLVGPNFGSSFLSPLNTCQPRAS